MKKITLLLLFISFTAFSQTELVNYDAVGLQFDFGFGGLSVGMGPDLNPDVTAPNTTANVRQLDVDATAGVFDSGYGGALLAEVDFENDGLFVNYLIRSDQNTFKIKVEYQDATDDGMGNPVVPGQNPSEGFAEYTGNGDWQLIEIPITFADLDYSNGSGGVDLGEASQVYERVAVLPDYDDTIDTAFTVWFDEMIQTSVSLSTSDFTKNKISVWPNPTTLVININAEIEEKTVDIYDLNGRLAITKEITGKFNSVDVSALSSGVYFLKLKNSTALKFVKK